MNESDPSGLASGCDNTNGAKQAACLAGQRAQAAASAPHCAAGSRIVGGQCTGTGAGQPCPSVNSTTGACNSAAWNANNPFSEGVGGFCFSGGAFLYGGGTGSACIVWNDEHAAFTLTFGGGGGYGYGASVGVLTSNAQCISALGGLFAEGGGGAGGIFAFGATNGKTTLGYGGIGLPGFEGYGGATNTWIVPLF